MFSDFSNELSDDSNDESGDEKEIEIFETVEEDFEPVRRSPRKPVPIQKGLEYNQIRFSRVPDNPKGVSVDRND
jgi:hypothetical protein